MCRRGCVAAEGAGRTAVAVAADDGGRYGEVADAQHRHFGGVVGVRQFAERHAAAASAPLMVWVCCVSSWCRFRADGRGQRMGCGCGCWRKEADCGVTMGRRREAPKMRRRCDCPHARRLATAHRRHRSRVHRHKGGDCCWQCWRSLDWPVAVR